MLYGALPPLTIKLIAPLPSPLHVTCVLEFVCERATGFDIVKDSLSVHPLASVIVTE